ncbi:unnamed protein product [Darwinula stevensoni]|uniref:Uncharacterized protein n=1 Tax=Darwinula stevensoni TaxID=69355 RepID=A0A7R9AH12_9CRUS|nr:unnamed protein product [Darwinula stevensoni]CAG0904666.1 unnamed protein product [Darwinula stevensoni]
MCEPYTNWNTIRESKSKLRDQYGLEGDMLFTNLVSMNIFTNMEEKVISNIKNQHDRFDVIFPILYSKDPMAYLPLFLAALNNVNPRAADYLQGLLLSQDRTTPKSATLDDVRRVKDILNNPNTIVNIDHFLDILSMKRVLSVVEEREIRRRSSYKGKIDSSFDILLAQDAAEMYEKLIGTLREMGRSDIVEKIQQT